MRRIVFAAAALAALMAAVPASAQSFHSNDPAAGDGSDGAARPGYGAIRHDLGYAIAGQPSRERAVTPPPHDAKTGGSKAGTTPRTDSY